MGPTALGARASDTPAPTTAAQLTISKAGLATADSSRIKGSLSQPPTQPTAQPTALLPLEPGPLQPDSLRSATVPKQGAALDAADGKALPAALPGSEQAERDDSNVAAKQTMQQPAKQQRRAAKPAALKADVKPSPAAALQQHLQQYRSSMEAVSAASLSLANLPQAYAARCLTQPGSEFIPSFQAGPADPTWCSQQLQWNVALLCPGKGVQMQCT